MCIGSNPESKVDAIMMQVCRWRTRRPANVLAYVVVVSIGRVTMADAT
jgi:hypothetical protein